uniref:Gem nuclear organelle associated protein 4 n=1 Tax=Sphenodon punctatus TaxID=8508 RepID=A0A8D0L6Q7_SPHPU
MTICGETTILHGGFLLAAKLCHPKPLTELAKSDWPKVGKPITDALQEICTTRSSHPPQPNAWKKKAAIIIWSKILLHSPPAHSTAASADQRWEEDVFFSATNMIPEINRTVLFELFKTVNAPRLFVQLLLVLPENVCVRELEFLVEYVSTETSATDLCFFLDVWWEIMKHKEGQEDRIVLMFRTMSDQHLSESPEEACQPSKRFKRDPLSCPDSPVTTGLFPILLDGLKQIKGCINLTKMKCYALANLTDMLSVLTVTEHKAESVPATEYLEKISSVVTIWSCDGENRYNQQDLDEKVKEAERSVSLLSVAILPSELQFVALGFLRALLEEWMEELQGLLNSPHQVRYESYRLLDSLATFRKNLVIYAKSGELAEDEAQMVSELAELIAEFLKKIDTKLQGKNSDRDLMASVAMAIIEQKMVRHAEMCSIFASEKDWAFSTDWVSCLVRNKALFQKPELVLKLLETTVAFSQSASNGESQEMQNKVTKVILECYAELSLPDKNKVISGVLATWGRKGLSISLKTFTEGFQEELNVAFNQIVQSVSDQGFKKAVTSVSRLALIHPEETVKKVCTLAVTNLGTHHFLAEILCSFPALHFQDAEDTGTSSNLLVGCLKETVWGRLSSTKDKEQFIEFLVFLMQPNSASPVLSPTEVTKNFVLPYLKSDFPHMELCLQILNKVLKMPLPSEGSWIKTCHPFPLILCLCKLLDGYTRYWHKSQDQPGPSLETKDLVVSNLSELCETLVAQKSSLSPELWTQSVAWLHKRVETLDWTVGLRLKSLYGEHFKNEVPATLFEVCKLSEDEWTSRPLLAYGTGSGLMAWMECCCISVALREQMLVLLSVNVDNPEEVNLFSKGFLVALIQVLPWCSQSEWKRLSHVIKSLLEREALHIPYSLEYVQYMPLLNLRPFAHELQFSVLFLRGFQFLCSSSCDTWLPAEAWKHVARLYCLSLADLLGSLKNDSLYQWHSAAAKNLTRELTFVYIQMFCHALHVAAMLPDDHTGEPLLLLSLEILSQYEVLSTADKSPSSSLRKANEKHFLESITENVSNKELRTMLLQKLSKL